jgi:hypothetical protein
MTFLNQSLSKVTCHYWSQVHLEGTMYTVLGTVGTMHNVWGIVEIMLANANGY